jgi:hypothetical protein
MSSLLSAYSETVPAELHGALRCAACARHRRTLHVRDVCV